MGVAAAALRADPKVVHHVVTDPSQHAPSPVLAIWTLWACLCLFMLVLWAIYRYAARAESTQFRMTLAAIALSLLGPLAIHWGSPLPWTMLLLCAGPVLAISYNEYGRRHCIGAFSAR